MQNSFLTWAIGTAGVPTWVSAPSDSPFISPQSDLSKSADLIIPCSTYKALTFSCSSRINAHLPRPAGQPPPGPCCSPPGPLHLCEGTRNLGPRFTQAPPSPASGPSPTALSAVLILPCLMFKCPSPETSPPPLPSF